MASVLIPHGRFLRKVRIPEAWSTLPRLLPDGRMPIFSIPGRFWTYVETEPGLFTVVNSEEPK